MGAGKLSRRVGAGRIAAALCLAGLSFAAPASATSLGGCPSGGTWQQVRVVDVLDPEFISGNPSLDGNGDGLTCIQYLLNHPAGDDIFVFRDNTVQRPGS
jgi:hypothetical protein